MLLYRCLLPRVLFTDPCFPHRNGSFLFFLDFGPTLTSSQSVFRFRDATSYTNTWKINVLKGTLCFRCQMPTVGERKAKRRCAKNSALLRDLGVLQVQEVASVSPRLPKRSNSINLGPSNSRVLRPQNTNSRTSPQQNPRLYFCWVLLGIAQESCL